MHKSFLAHSHRDAALAMTVRDLLRSTGLDVVSLDSFIASGDSIAANLRRMIDESDALIAVVSPDAIESRWLFMELGAAWAMGKRIIPIATGDVSAADLPPPHSEIQFLRVDEPRDLEPEIRRIATSLNEKPNSQELPTQQDTLPIHDFGRPEDLRKAVIHCNLTFGISLPGAPAPSLTPIEGFGDRSACQSQVQWPHSDVKLFRSEAALRAKFVEQESG